MLLTRRLSKYKAIKNSIILKIRKKFNSSSADGVVVNISGGLDSTVVARLVQLALPTTKISLLYLPVEQNEFDLSCVRKLADTFDLDYKIINIKKCVDAVIRSSMNKQLLLPTDSSKKIIGNIISRLRMVHSYLESNLKNLLVIGTTNYSEFLLGYGTKFGDCASDFNPIIGLHKEDVFILASLLDVPNAIIEREPSAGLWPGQTDEKELGFSYTDLKRYLVNAPLSTVKFNKIKSRLDSSRHKSKSIESSVLAESC